MQRLHAETVAFRIAHAAFYKTQLQVEQFTYDRQDRVFISEASDLGWRGGEWPRRFTITNDKTGQRATFERGVIINSNGGAFGGFVYVNDRFNCTAHVFND